MTTAPRNPLLYESSLPYGLPDFSLVTAEQLRAALEEAMARQASAWEEIVTTEGLADVANTIEAIARAQAEFSRVVGLFYTYVGSIGTQEYLDLDTEYRARLAEHSDAFWLDERMYRRFQSLERAQGLLDLTPDLAYYVRTTAEAFRRGGVGLDAGSRGALRDLNTHLASLEADFNQRVTKGTEDATVQVEDPAHLDGLDSGTKDTLRSGESFGLTLVNTTQQPLAAQLTDAHLRRDLLDASTSRCGQRPFGAPPARRASHAGGAIDDPLDTRATLLEIARLRAARAQLLDFAHHAAVVADGNDAGTSEAIDGLLNSIAAPAMTQADAEIAGLASLGQGDVTDPAALSYLYTQQRKVKAEVDDEVLRPYLELSNVIERGMFYAATLLYGITFTERTDLAGYTEDVRVWEVHDADGSGIGLFLGDFYHRPGKQGGAWMHSLVDQSHLLGTRPVICNNANVRKPSAGQPTLLTWDEVRTCFHEFGHALHGLLSDVHLPQQSGTHVQRDTVEYPSQVNEMWQSHPRVLAHFAQHHETGQAMPEHLVAKVAQAEEISRGFDMVEHAAAVMLDQGWHRLAPDQVPDDPAEVDAIEERLLAEAGLGHALIPPRYRSSYFRHTFGGGYDAGYYSYLWAEQLDADTVEWFRTVASQGEDGGLNRSAGDRFRREVLSRGGTRPVSDSFHALRGRDVRPEALLARHGLLP